MKDAANTTAAPETIPAEIKQLNRWFLWKRENGTKVPYQSSRPYKRASSTDPATWSSYDRALSTYLSGKADGIAIVLGQLDDGRWLSGVDLDDCIVDGTMVPEAVKIIDDLDTYTEVSPSGNGVKTLLYGKKPGTHCQIKPGTFKKIEVYDHDRFWTITGNTSDDGAYIQDRQDELEALYNRLWPDKPAAPSKPTTGTGFSGDDEDLIGKARTNKHGDRFVDLYDLGDLSRYEGDASDADLALCSTLAFYCGPDPERIDRLFRKSALYRDKWDEQRGEQTYGERTIATALKGKTEFYSGTKTQQQTDTAITLCDGVVIDPIEVRATPTKRTLRAGVTINGTDTEMELTASDTAKGIRDAWSSLLEIADLTDNAIDDEAKVGLKKVLTRKRLNEIAQQIEKNKPVVEAPAGVAMADVADAFARNNLKMAFSVEDHLWSEAMGRLFKRSDFTNHVPSDLLRKIEACSDYPAPTDSDPTKPVKHLQQVLKTTWSDLLGVLPREVNADLGADSKAAEAFEAKLVSLWSSPETWIKIEDQGKTQIERMSLASRARQLANSDRRQAKPWTRVLRGVNAYYHIDDQSRVWLGMRYDLLGGVIRGHAMPGIENQRELHRLLSRYGLLDDTGVSDRYRDHENGRRDRIAVLDQRLSDLLIECVDPDDEHATGPESDAEDGPDVAEGLTYDPTTGEVIEA